MLKAECSCGWQFTVPFPETMRRWSMQPKIKQTILYAATEEVIDGLASHYRDVEYQASVDPTSDQATDEVLSVEKMYRNAVQWNDRIDKEFTKHHVAMVDDIGRRESWSLIDLYKSFLQDWMEWIGNEEDGVK